MQVRISTIAVTLLLLLTATLVAAENSTRATVTPSITTPFQRRC